MNVLYICKLSAYQAEGNQIDIPKKIAMDFFGASEDVIKGLSKLELNVCHAKNNTKFTQIEIQPATNPRFSTSLNSFLKENGDVLSEGDLLVVEKIGRSYCVRLIKSGNDKYDSLMELFDKDEKHMILTAFLDNLSIDSKIISSDYRQYITAIKSKPFLLLAGISGTGKSRVVRELARACWDENSEEYAAHKPKNFEMVQVKPNWHDSSELIGYVSRIDGEKYVVGPFMKFLAKALKDPDNPYFLCLDEMNLAPVEQYFAEYLSVVESRKVGSDGIVVTDPIVDYEPTDAYKSLIDQLFEADDEIRAKYLKEEGGKRLTIPQNLIVVGTVNMDETTFSFSRKVLDRAMTIEMNEVNLGGGLDKRHEKIGKLSNVELVGNAVEGVDVYSSYKEVCDKVIDYLKKVNEKLDKTPFKIAYRTRNEFLLYVVNNLPYNKDKEGKDIGQDFIIKRALDEMTSMKILSRIEGDADKTERVLNDLESLLKEQLKDLEKSISLEKIVEMKEKLNRTQYTSFWS